MKTINEIIKNYFIASGYLTEALNPSAVTKSSYLLTDTELTNFTKVSGLQWNTIHQDNHPIRCAIHNIDGEELFATVNTTGQDVDLLTFYSLRYEYSNGDTFDIYVHVLDWFERCGLSSKIPISSAKQYFYFGNRYLKMKSAYAMKVEIARMGSFAKAPCGLDYPVFMKYLEEGESPSQPVQIITADALSEMIEHLNSD